MNIVLVKPCKLHPLQPPTTLQFEKYIIGNDADQSGPHGTAQDQKPVYTCAKNLYLQGWQISDELAGTLNIGADADGKHAGKERVGHDGVDLQVYTLVHMHLHPPIEFIKQLPQPWAAGVKLCSHTPSGSIGLAGLGLITGISEPAQAFLTFVACTCRVENGWCGCLK